LTRARARATLRIRILGIRTMMKEPIKVALSAKQKKNNSSLEFLLKINNLTL